MRVMVGTDEGLLVDGDVQLKGRPITDVRVLGDDVWALVEGHEVWHSAAGPAGPFARQWDIAPAEGLCVLPVPSAGVLIGTTEAHLLWLTVGDVQAVGGFEEADGRDEWYTPWGGPPDVRSLTLGADRAVFANVHVGGIVRSLDGGRSWAPTIDIHADVHQVLAHPGRPELVVAACAEGLAVSHDRGSSWVVDDDGLPEVYARAVAIAGSTLLLSVSSGPGGSRSGVYWRPLDLSAPFVPCKGLPAPMTGNVDTGWLAGDPEGGDAAMVDPEGRLYRSGDEGRTWALVGDGVGPGPLALVP